jgi:hypothetical protein
MHTYSVFYRLIADLLHTNSVLGRIFADLLHTNSVLYRVFVDSVHKLRRENQCHSIVAARAAGASRRESPQASWARLAWEGEAAALEGEAGPPPPSSET